MCRIRWCPMQVTLLAIACISCNPVVCQEIIFTDNTRLLNPGKLRQGDIVGFEYNKTLVIKQDKTDFLILLNGHADPVLYGSKAYLTAWKMDSIEELNSCLSHQSDVLFAKPEGIDESKSVQVVLSAEQRNFSIFGVSFFWMPGGPESGSIGMTFLKHPVKVAILDQEVRFPPFGENDFVALDEYSAQYVREKAERLKKIERELERRVRNDKERPGDET